MDRNYVASHRERNAGGSAEHFPKIRSRRACRWSIQTASLVGIVTQDDMLDVAEEEATEDIQKIGGMEALDEPYMRIPLWRMVQKRAGWLIILFLGEMLTATAMQVIRSEIEKAVVLAMFLPLIISSGGNSGSQASTLMIRAMALGEVTSARLVARRAPGNAAGLSFGLILGINRFLRMALWSMSGEHILIGKSMDHIGRRSR